MLVSDTVTNGFEFSVTRERFRPAGTSADRDCSRSSPASRCRTSHGPAGSISEAHGLQMSRIPPRAPFPNGIARGRRCRLRSKFAADSLLEGGVSSEPVSEVEVLAPGNYDTIPRPLWMIIEAEKGYFGLKTAEFQSLLPWQLHCHLGPKLLMTRSFLPSGVLVAGEFTVYKRAGTSALSARPAKNLILFSHLECQGTYTNLPRSRRSCPLPI